MRNRRESSNTEQNTQRIIQRNGDFDERVERIRALVTPPATIEKPDKAGQTMKVNAQYTKERKEFRTNNLEKTKFVQNITKQTLKPKIFYPYIIKEPQAVSLKDQNKPNIEIKKGTVDTNQIVLSKDGHQSFNVAAFFNTYLFIQCSVQYKVDNRVMPDYDFFMFDEARGYEHQLKQIFVEYDDSAMGNEANQIRKKFKKLYNNMTFFDMMHMIVSDILPESSRAKLQYAQKLSNPDISIFPQNQERCFQVNDDREEWENEPSNVYIGDITAYRKYRREQATEIKKLNIYSAEKQNFTDIRFILHPQKTYFIQIMQEVREVTIVINETADDTSFDITVLEQLYEFTKTKAQQFLLLICTYIPSSIDLQVRANRLSEYFWDNFMFLSQIHEVSQELLEKYPVLASWYSMPQKMFGYDRDSVQHAFYELVKGGCKLQKRFNYMKKKQELMDSNREKLKEIIEKRAKEAMKKKKQKDVFE